MEQVFYFYSKSSLHVTTLTVLVHMLQALQSCYSLSHFLLLPAYCAGLPAASPAVTVDTILLVKIPHSVFEHPDLEKMGSWPPHHMLTQTV